MRNFLRIISGLYRGRPIETPKTLKIRPTSDKVRQAIFNIIEHSLGFNFKEKIIADLFGGTGAFGFEALSRGADKVIYLDISKEAYQIACNNAQALGVTEKCQFLLSDITHLPFTNQKIDLIFMDPPYNQKLGEKTLQIIYDQNWVSKESVVVLEESKKANLILPNPFKIIDRRFYGDTVVYFLSSF